MILDLSTNKKYIKWTEHVNWMALRNVLSFDGLRLHLPGNCNAFAWKAPTSSSYFQLCITHTHKKTRYFTERIIYCFCKHNCEWMTFSFFPKWNSLGLMGFVNWKLVVWFKLHSRRKECNIFVSSSFLYFEMTFLRCTAWIVKLLSWFL